MNLLPAGANIAYYKHLSGEYHTANAFALWLAAMILKKETLPGVVKLRVAGDAPITDIVIYNHFRNLEHSLIHVAKA
jgi:hypothetical protein